MHLIILTLTLTIVKNDNICVPIIIKYDISKKINKFSIYCIFLELNKLLLINIIKKYIHTTFNIFINFKLND